MAMPEAIPVMLVVDDEEWVRLALGKLLQGAGYEVATAGGAAAGRMIQQRVYDMVVVGLTLKDVDGMEVLKAARAQSYDPEVLIITAHGTWSPPSRPSSSALSTTWPSRSIPRGCC